MSDKKILKTYDMICEMQNKGVYSDAVKFGLISTTINYQKNIYESYLNNKKRNLGIEQAMSDTCEDFGISKSYVKKVRKFMNS